MKIIKKLLCTAIVGMVVCNFAYAYTCIYQENLRFSSRGITGRADSYAFDSYGEMSTYINNYPGISMNRDNCYHAITGKMYRWSSVKDKYLLLPGFDEPRINYANMRGQWHFGASWTPTGGYRCERIVLNGYSQHANSYVFTKKTDLRPRNGKIVVEGNIIRDKF